MKVDDFGCFYADPRLLKANLYPLRLEKVREADCSRWTAECQKAGLIALYSGSNQKRYLQIQDFRQRLDKAKAKFPLPTDVNGVPEVVNDFPAEVEVEREVEVEKKGGEGFAPPAKDDVVELMFEKLDEFSAMGEAEKFINFYQSKNWFVGKTKMKDWRAAARGWVGRINDFKTHVNGKESKPGTSAARNATGKDW